MGKLYDARLRAQHKMRYGAEGNTVPINRRHAGIGIAILAAIALVAFLVYLLWGFFVALILLSLVYFGIACGIIAATAWYYDAEFEEYLRDNNTWFYVLVGAAAVTFVIALFHFGPAILLPENTPSKELRGTLGNFFQHVLRGKNAPAPTTPTTPLPWAAGTWFWWKAWLFYFLLSIGYFPFAFADEIHNAIRAVHERHEEEEERRRQQPPAAPAQRANEAPRIGFGQLLKVELVGEVLSELVLHLIRRFTGAREVV